MFTIPRFLFKKLQYIANKYAIKPKKISNAYKSWKILFNFCTLMSQKNPALIKYVIKDGPPVIERGIPSSVNISINSVDLLLKQTNNKIYNHNIYPLNICPVNSVKVRIITKTGEIKTQSEL